jgi:hypothetical protein
MPFNLPLKAYEFFRRITMQTKTILNKNKAISMILIIGACAIALYIGFETYSRYPNAVQGIQGLATIYLLYLLYVPPKNFVRDPVGIQLEFPRVIKYIVPHFFLCLIGVWSAEYLADAISFFLRTVMHITW